MSKAILVINTPKSCYECRFHEVDDDFTVEEVDVCNAYCDVILENEMKNKPSWCPLKPLPQSVDDLGLEVWNSRNGSMLAPKGLFDEIYNGEEECTE